MSTETLVSSYILRLSIKRNRWRIGLHNVRTGEALVFSSFEDLAKHLETHSFQIVNASSHQVNASSFRWNADGTPIREDEPMK